MFNSKKSDVRVDSSNTIIELPELSRRALGIGSFAVVFMMLAKPGEATSAPQAARQEFHKSEGFAALLDRLSFWEDARFNPKVNNSSEAFFHIVNYPVGFLESDQNIHSHMQSLAIDRDQFRMLEQQGAVALDISTHYSSIDQWPKEWFATHTNSKSVDQLAEISLPAVLASYDRSLNMLATAARRTMEVKIQYDPNIKYARQ